MSIDKRKWIIDSWDTKLFDILNTGLKIQTKLIPYPLRSQKNQNLEHFSLFQ